MPNLPKRPCRGTKRGCKALTDEADGYCPACRPVRHADTDRWRGSARERGYTWAWEKARARFLKQHPLCVECKREGRYIAATDVDHIIPHRGDERLFWDESNWQGLCSPHHKRKTGRGE